MNTIEVQHLEVMHGSWRNRDAQQARKIAQQLDAAYAELGVSRSEAERIHIEVCARQDEIFDSAGYCHAYDPPCKAKLSRAQVYGAAATELNKQNNWQLVSGYRGASLSL